MTDIIIADDHAVVRHGLRQILQDAPEIKVIDEASDGKELLDRARGKRYDLVLLDLSMPVIDGLEALKALKKENPKLPVLILSMHPEEQYAIRALKLGASGYITKENAPAELIAAVRKVLRGGKYITLSLAERLAVDMEKGHKKHPHDILSGREYAVLRMIASGMRLKQIADELSLSVKTVSTYRSRILEKMGMESNAELINYAIRNNLPCRFTKRP